MRGRSVLTTLLAAGLLGVLLGAGYVAVTGTSLSPRSPGGSAALPVPAERASGPVVAATAVAGRAPARVSAAPAPRPVPAPVAQAKAKPKLKKAPKPKAAKPKAAKPKAAKPKTPEPKTPEPRTPEPKAAGDHSKPATKPTAKKHR